MNYTAKDVARMLADRAESVCKHLIPNGKISGAEWEVGSVEGEAGRSLKVKLTGSRAGVWCDFSTGEDKGDLLDLWRAVRKTTLGDAIREAKDFLGIREPTFLPSARKYSKPKSRSIKLSLESPAMAYLTKERKLTQETLENFRIGDQSNEIVLPSYTSDGTSLVAVKYLSVERTAEGKKTIRTERGCAPCLFGWQALPDDCRSVVITEGEIDAMTMAQYGFPSLSVPFGAGTGEKQAWIDVEWDSLARFDTIYLAFDGDEEGRASIPEVAKRLGLHRCRVVTLPFKDANACLQKGITTGQMIAAVNGSRSLQPPEICDAARFTESVIDYFYPSPKQAGFSPPILGGKVSFRPSELTVWTGVSGHGKSLLTGQLMLMAALAGEKVAIASMEMKPAQTLGRMLRQFLGKDLPSKEEIERALGWLGGKIWIYDIAGNVPTDKLLELMLYSRCRHGVSQFVIDSLMKCGVASDDYNLQREFLNSLVGFAKEHGCHVHLIAHPRKGDDEHGIVGKLEIKGSSDIVNQSDNCLTVWRNKKKEEKVRSGQPYSMDEPDAVVFCDKQRETGWEGKIPLYFMPGIQQFVDKQFGKIEPLKLHWVLAS